MSKGLTIEKLRKARDSLIKNEEVYGVTPSRVFLSSSGIIEEDMWGSINIKKFIVEEKMDQFVINNYPVTEDALLVQKHIAPDLPCNKVELNQIILGGHTTELLQLAKQLETEENNNINNA